MVDNPRLLKAFAFPLDEDLPSDRVATWIGELVRVGWLTSYEDGGRRYLAITNFREHQHPQKPQRSKLPAPPSAQVLPDTPTSPAALALSSPAPTSTIPVLYRSATPPVPVSPAAENDPRAVPVGREGKGEEGRGRGEDYQPSARPPAAAGPSPAEPESFDLDDDPEESGAVAVARTVAPAVALAPPPPRVVKAARAPRTGLPKAPTAKWPHFAHEEREWICQRLVQARKRDLTSGEIGWVTKAFGERWYTKPEHERHPDRPTNAEIRQAVDEILAAASAADNGRHFYQPVNLADSIGLVVEELRQLRWDPVERLDAIDRLLGLRRPRIGFVR
jgi:hypothetical protein